MADSSCLTDFRRCNNFFLYDASKVQEEGDPTRAGICFFYPEDTPLDQQELLCGQLAGACRCVSELSCSPVRLLRLHKSKFAVRMRERFLWALRCPVDIPDVSVCELLDQLIGLFCFYNGPVRQSYQLRSCEALAMRWARYLTHLQAGSSELHRIFRCLRTLDSTHVDPLLLLKAALILQACQRCPLVLAGCVLYRGRVVSTQMPPELTVKVMVHETESYCQDQRPITDGTRLAEATPSSSSTGTTTVFLTPAELQVLRCPPVDRVSRPHCSPQAPSQPRKSRLLSRTLSDTLPEHLDATSIDPNESSCHSSISDESCFSHSPSATTEATVSQHTPAEISDSSPLDSSKSQDHGLSNGVAACGLKDEMDCGAGLNNPHTEEVEMGIVASEMKECGNVNAIVVNGNDCQTNGSHMQQEPKLDPNQTSGSPKMSDSNCKQFTEDISPSENTNTQKKKQSKKNNEEEIGEEGEPEKERRRRMKTKSTEVNGRQSRGDRQKSKSPICRGESGVGESPSSLSSPEEDEEEEVLVPMMLYQHRVRALVLALLVEPHFHNDQAAVQEVYHSSLASLNGLEAHLRTTTPGAPGPPGPYTFAHYDCIQNTLTTNLSGQSGLPQDRSFVKATALLHSHFSQTPSLQEAIVRSAGAAVYGMRSPAQETYFLQQPASSTVTMRNSGVPNHQDSAFSLPSKARHRLLKHGVNLL